MTEQHVKSLMRRSRMRGMAVYGQTRGGERSGRWELVVIGGSRLGFEDFDEAARIINATRVVVAGRFARRPRVR